VATIKESWQQTPATTNALTVTGLSTLANNSSATSNLIDNSSGLFLDCILQCSIGAGASGVSATGYCDVFVSSSLDNSSFADANNDIYIDTIQIIANSVTYVKIISVAKALQGALPPYFKIRFNNQSAAAFASATVVQNLLAFTVV
jgi:hypothetical protein